jgi:glycosyltransferase involved in cell wall biosynthesis
MDARPLSTPMSGVGRLLHETILAFPKSAKVEFFLFSHRPIHSSHKKILEDKNMYWIQGEGILSKKGGTYYNILLPFLLKSFSLDLFWGSQQVLPPFLPNSLPAVLTYCDLVLYLYPETMRTIARWQQRFFQAYSVHRSSHILSISKNTEVDMIQKFNYPPERASVAYPGIDGKSIQILLKNSPSEIIKSLNKNYILSVSTIEPRKNYSFLLKVFEKLRNDPSSKKINQLKWVIAGKRGWESEDFFQKLDFSVKTHKDIIILDSIDDSDLHHLYKNAGLFWMASHYEGFGIPLLEALYHNVMSICSDIPTFREIGKDSILYFPTSSKDDIQAWVSASLDCLKRGMKFNGNIKSFTWENGAHQTLLAFQKVLKEFKTK